MFGLKPSDVDSIVVVLERFPQIEEAIIFGSRAMGNYRHGSDVDMALSGAEVTLDIAVKVADILNEETLMPYRFDVLSINDISNTDLIDHIQRVGKMLYTRYSGRMAGEPASSYS